MVNLQERDFYGGLGVDGGTILRMDIKDIKDLKEIGINTRNLVDSAQDSD